MAACDLTRPLTQAEREAGYDQQRTGVGQALRPFSGTPSIENLLDYINRELVPCLRATRRAANDVWKQVVDNAPSANPLAFYFSTTTAAADPTPGRVRLNQATQNTATIIRVSESNGRLQSVQPWLDVMSGGPTSPLGTVTLLDAINPGRFLRFDLNTMTDQGAYWDLGVTFIEGSDASPFVDDEAVTIGFIAGVSAAGSTVPVGSLSPVANDTFLGNVSGAPAAPSAVNLSTLAGAGLAFAAHTLDVTGSTSITIASDQVQRAALTGEVTASQNSNACTVTRSTDFQSSPWTGNHQFNAEVRMGTLHTESAVSGALNVTLTAGATRLLITSTADVTLGTISGCAEGRILYVEHARSSGSGNLVVSHASSTANAISCPGDRPHVVRGRGGFTLVGRGGVWKLLNRDINTAVIQTDAGGGGNNFALDDATNILFVSANATYTGFVRASGNFEGDCFYLQATNAITVTLPFNSSSSTSGNRTAAANSVDLVIGDRGLIFLQYRNSVWRIQNAGDAMISTANTFTASNTFGAQLCFGNTITPTALSADQNNYNPTGWSTANIVRLSTNSGTTRVLTGAAAGSSGELKWLVNLGPGFVQLDAGSTSSTSTNRFLHVSGTTLTLSINGVCGILYDPTSARWRCIYPDIIT